MSDHEKALQIAKLALNSNLPDWAHDDFKAVSAALLAYAERDKVLEGIMANLPEALQVGHFGVYRRTIEPNNGQHPEGHAVVTEDYSDKDGWLGRTCKHLGAVLCNARSALASIKPATKE